MTLKPNIKVREIPLPMGCDGLHTAMLAHVNETFGRRNDNIHPPTWLVQVPGALITLETDWADDREKMIHVHAMEQLLSLRQATGYSFACEAWVSQYGPDEHELAKHVLPSQRAKRDDVLMVHTQMRNGDARYTRFMVMGSGTPRAKLGVQIDDDHRMDGGILMNLFDARRVRSVEEAIAKRNG